MKKITFLFSALFISLIMNAQIIDRIEVKGRIIVDVNDIEGVTVFNTSSNKGTITNTKGEFAISVRLNDVVEISALQFEKITVRIDEKILNNKYFTVYLVERINKLDEVIITPYDMLSGNLIVDVKSVETFNPDLDAIYFGVNDIYSYEFTDDYKSKVVNTAMTPGHMQYGVNVLGLLSAILEPVFKSNKPKEKKKGKDTYQTPEIPVNDITDVFGREFITNTFKVPESEIEAFVAFVQANSFDYDMLNENNEVKLIEHLYAQSQQFLKSEDDKD